MKTEEFSPLIQPLYEPVNRSALLIVPNEVYYNWGRCVIKEQYLLNQCEAELFLIPSFSTPGQAESFLRTFYDLFFQYELKKWNVSSAYWPVNRTFELFNKWFEVRFSYCVSDILVQPVLKKSEEFHCEVHDPFI
jgi:hypothetical protein